MTGKPMFRMGAQAGAPRPKSVMRMLAFGTAILFLASVAVGYVVGWRRNHDAFDAELGIALGLFALLIGGCAWLLFREVRKPAGSDPLTPKERINLNILIGGGLAGGVMSVMMAMVGSSTDAEMSLFSDRPIPPAFAIAMLVSLGLFIPVCVYWHRVVDEQEADAYKTGALWGMYVYWFGSAAWWFAWRGGFAPEPNGVSIYLITTFTVGAIWLWKKYR